MKKLFIVSVVLLMCSSIWAVGNTINDPIIIDFPHTYVYSDSGSNITYTNDYDVPGSDGKDIVYYLSIPYNVIMNITTEGSDYDTKIAIYNAGTVNPSSTNQLYYNDDYYGAQAGFRNLSLSSVNDYYVILDANGGAEGNYNIEFQYVPLQGESYANPFNVTFDNNHQFFTNQSIQQFVDDYDFAGPDNKDAVYTFEFDGNYLFSANINQVSFDVKFFLYDSSVTDPDSTNYLVAGTQSYAIQNYSVSAGRYYLIVDSGVDNSGIFELQMQYVTYQGDEQMNPLSVTFIQDSVFTDNINTDNFNNTYDTPGLDSKDVVYVMTADIQKSYDIITTSQTFHPHITIYDDTVTGFNSNNYLHHNSDFSTDSAGFRNLVLDPGTYYVVIDGENTNGDVYLGIIKKPLQGDFYYNPIPIDITPGETWVDSGSTAYMSDDYDIPGGDSKDVVYSLMVAAATNIDISLDGSSFDTKIGIYRAGTPIDNVSHIMYNDDYYGIYSAILNFSPDPGLYYIVVDGNPNEFGNYRIQVDMTPYSTGFVAGYITSSEDSSPLQNVLITTGDISEYTDSTGYYYLENVPLGFHQIRAALQGYSARSSDMIEVTGGDTTQVSLSLDVFDGNPGVPVGLYHIDDFENIKLHWQPAGTLWSQIFNEGDTEAHNAQDYVNGNTGYNSAACADFTLKDSAHVEAARFLMSWGTIQYDQPISFTVKIYTDSMGTPNQEVLSFTSAPVSMINNTYKADFPVNTYLSAGDYWISYQAVVDWNLTGAQAFAVVTPYLYKETPGIWKNPGGQYGFGTDWITLDPPFSTDDSKDFCFEIIGTYGPDQPEVVTPPTMHNGMRTSGLSAYSSGRNIQREPLTASIDFAQGMIMSRDLLMYNVYRDGSQVNTQPVYLPRYTDQNLTDGSYDYYVTAVYEEGVSQPTETHNVIVNTDRIGTIVGWITDSESDEPLSNVLVSVNGTSAVTDSLGFYTLDESHGQYQLTASVEDYYDYTHAELIQINARTTDTLSFSMTMIPPAGIVSGYVYNTNSGNRIIGATITIGESQTTSTQNGLYTLSVSPGEYNVVCSKLGYDTFTSDTTVTIVDDGTINFVVPLSIHVPAGTLNGTVTDLLTNEPIEGAEIAIGDSVAISDSLGYYSVYIYENHYLVTCSADDYYGDSRYVTIVDHSITQADFILTPIDDEIIPPTDLIGTIQRYNNLYLSWSEPRDPDLQELRHDDGAPDLWTWPGIATGNQYYAVKFTNDQALSIENVKFYGRVRNDIEEDIETMVCPDDGTGHPDILNPVFIDTVQASTVSYSGQWITAYPQLGVNTQISENFFVVIKWNRGNSFTVGTDTDQPDNMSYAMNEDSGWVVQTDGDFIVRAVVNINDLNERYSTETRTMPERELIGYNVYRDSILVNQSPIVETHYLDSQMQNGSYEYFVRAVYHAGESSNSGSISTEIDFNGYYPPDYLTAVNSGIFDVTLEWLQPSEIQAGQVISGYNIYMDSGSNMVASVSDPDSLMITIEDVSPGTHMFWTTATYSDAVPEAESPRSGVAIVCIRPRIFFPPENLEYKVFVNTVSLEWDTPEFPENCSIEPFLTGYRIYKDNQSIGEVPLSVRVFNDLDPQLGISDYFVTAVYKIYESPGSDTVSVEIVSIEDWETVPKVTEFTGNYPNPFNPETTLNYSISKENDNKRVEMSVYNIKGQKVAVLVDENQPAGYHSVVWKGRDSRQKSVSSGVYFVIMKCGSYKNTSKMIMLK